MTSNASALAQFFSVTPRTVFRWQKSGVDLSSPSGVADYVRSLTKPSPGVSARLAPDLEWRLTQVLNRTQDTRPPLPERMLHTLRDALTELRVAMRILENDPELRKLFPDPLAQFNAPSNTGELLRALCSAYAPLKEVLRELGAVLDRQPLSRVSWDR